MFAAWVVRRDGWRLEDCGAEVPEAPGAAPDVRVLHASLAGPSSEAARALHQRFEQLMFFFIDGLTQIQRSDPGWEVLFACVQHRPAGGQPQWVPVGIAALYRHFHYPDKTRLKLSQLFVLPPCRGRGVGRQLLRAAQEMALSDAGVVDFTLEDPTPIVTRMRDVAGALLRDDKGACDGGVCTCVAKVPSVRPAVCSTFAHACASWYDIT